MQTNNLLLFVYGTLRRDCPSGAHRQYLQGAQFIGAAKTCGHLFLIDYYPGFSPAPTPSDNSQNSALASWVVGEVYLLVSEAQLLQLDRYEGCASDSPAPQEYSRRQIHVTLATGETITPWTYIYNGDSSPFATLVSGDFLQP